MIQRNLLMFMGVILICLSCESKSKQSTETISQKSYSSEVIGDESSGGEGTDENISLTSHINFYFENSRSMDGYLNGRNFKQTMHHVLGKINNENLSSFFVNTASYSTTDILNKIDTRNIATSGRGNSDHKFIFKKAIENAIGNNLSIVVTDGIYSVTDGDIDVVEIDIMNAFETALEENKIETVILKLSSNFSGTYYSESCEPGQKAISINQARPYYLLLFGTKETIDEALKDIVITNDLPGFKEKARFFISEDNGVNYSILTQGEEKHGNFETSNRREEIVRSIQGAERFSLGTFRSTPPKEKYLGFGIAINYSNFPLPDSYLQNARNYKVDNLTGYNVIEITRISDLNQSTQTYRALNRLKNKYTHIIKVKGIQNLYGNLIISLENNLPTWIQDTGIENDCEIIGNTEQTFAFDQLINGISNAYQRVNKDDKYLKINLNIEP